MKPPLQIVPIGMQTTFAEVWRWSQELERLYARIAPRFTRPEPQRRALVFLKGIVSAVERKNGRLASFLKNSDCTRLSRSMKRKYKSVRTILVAMHYQDSSSFYKGESTRAVPRTQESCR